MVLTAQLNKSGNDNQTESIPAAAAQRESLMPRKVYCS